MWCATTTRPRMSVTARDLRGRPEHLARFSDETAPDTRTTDRQKVPVYATVRAGAPIEWYDDLLTRFPDAPEVKSGHVLASFEGLPNAIQRRVWCGLREVTIHISDPRPYLGSADEVCLTWLGMRFQTLILRAKHTKSEVDCQISERLSSLIGQQMLEDSLGNQLSRILQIDVGNMISQLRRPRQSIIASVAEYTARGSAAFAPAYERATTYQGEADNRRFWFGPNPTDLVFRGTLKPLEDGHAFDAGNKRLTNILDDTRRRMVERLTRTSAFAIQSSESRDVSAFVDMDSMANRRIQAADIAAGFARHVLGREGPRGLIRRWAKVYYNGSRITENNLDPVLRFWSDVGSGG